MAYEFRLPDLGEGLTEGEIVKWLVKVGDRVQEGQVFVQVETDKALIEIPCPTTGSVLRILAAEGEIVRVGQVIIVFGDEAERLESVMEPARPGPRPSAGVVGELEEAQEEAPPPPVPKMTRGRSTEPLAMPAVRRLAKGLGVDLSSVKGSGPGGRITAEDVQLASTAKASQPSEVRATRKYDLYGFIERIPLRGMRKTIAKAMVTSKYTAPHVTAMDEVDATRLVALREKGREKAAQKGIHLTYMPFVIKAVVAALHEHPYLNASLEEETETIVLKKYYNIGVAVDTGEGLMVPVVKHAGEKAILQLAQELEALSEKARSRTIDLADLRGGTFTITNYGAVGGLYGTPIIHHPEVAILGLGRIVEKPVVVQGKVEIRKVLPLSLSFDHRVVDGAEAARFMNTLIRYLEDPDLILLQG